MMAQEDRENFYRAGSLIYETGTETEQKLLDFHLAQNQKPILLQNFIDMHSHELFHLYSKLACCRCVPGQPLLSKQSILTKKQMTIIFDKGWREPTHNKKNSDVFCCRRAKIGLRVDHLDITLLHTLLVNTCCDLFWGYCLDQQHLTIEQFLNKNTHFLYHLFQKDMTLCCLGPSNCSSSVPVVGKIKQIQWDSLYHQNTASKKCHIFGPAGCACIYNAKSGLNENDIDKDLSSVIHRNLCELRMAVDKMSSFRNDLAHSTSFQLSRLDFETIRNEATTHIRTIARYIGQETRVQAIIETVLLRPLEDGAFNRLVASLLEFQNLQHNITEDIGSLREGMREVRSCLSNIVEKQDQILKATEPIQNIDEFRQEICNEMNLRITEGIKTFFQGERTAVLGESYNAVKDNKEQLNHSMHNMKIKNASEIIRHDVRIVKASEIVVLKPFSSGKVPNGVVTRRQYKNDNTEDSTGKRTRSKWSKVKSKCCSFASRLVKEKREKFTKRIKEEANYDHPEDRFRCGPCGKDIYGGINNVFEHRKNCQAREEDRALKETAIFEVYNLPRSNENRLKHEGKQNAGSLDTDEIVVIDANLGSLLLWTKISKACFLSRKAFGDAIQKFFAKVLRENPLDTTDETDLTVTVHMLDDFCDLESDDLEGDIYQCGICEEQFTRLKGFLYHKKDKCSRKPQLVSDIPEHTKKVTKKVQEEISAHHTVQEKQSHKHKRKNRTTEEIKTNKILTTAAVNYSDAIDIDLPSTNEDAYDFSSEQKQCIHNESFSVYSDSIYSSTKSRVDETFMEDNALKNIKVSYYEKSKQLQNQERGKSFTEKQLLQFGLQLSEKFLRDLKYKFRRLPRKSEHLYTPLVQDKILFQEVYDQNPTIYRKALLKIRSSNSSVCTLLEPYNDCETVEISGRSRCGKAYTDDEVYVEIHQEKCHKANIKIMKRNMNVSANLYGKVIGLINRNRYDKIDHPVLICELDKYEYDKAKPVCKTVPKFHLLSENLENKPRPFCVDLYNYDEFTRKLIFNKSLQISPAFRQNYLFYVAFISWDGIYPLGAIIKVHEYTNDLMSALRILELQYKVPTLYSSTTIRNVDRILNASFMNSREKRYDLTEQCNAFTIYHKSSDVLEDALSINTLPTGGYRVGVHITDVRSFVEIASPLDKEARQRGTTIFRGQFGDPHQMLPEPISKNKCSLKKGQHRLALSIFYHFDEEFRVIYTDTKCCKSVIRSSFQITYAELQEILVNRAHHQVKDDILKLFEISKSLRKRRLGNGMFSFTYDEDVFEDDENVNKFAEAYFLKEELKILTNHSVATYLLRQFPDCIPLRCQDPPPDRKLEKWINAYPKVSDLILRLQGYPKSPNMTTKIDINNFNTQQGSRLRYTDIMCVQKWLWSTMTDYFHNNDTTKAADYLKKEELHPFHALAIAHWKSIQTIAEYRCSGMYTGSKVKHFTLGVFPYTHVTAPLRRYVDIVVQRLLHAAIDGKPSPYSCEDVHAVCQDMNEIAKKATEYENQCKSLFFANKVNTSPFIVHAFANLDNDEEFSLLIPECSFLQKHCTKLNVNLLGLNERPKYKADIEKLNAEAGRQCMVLTWKDRIYSTSGRKPFPKYPQSGYMLTQNDRPQKIDPHQKTVFKQMSIWIEFIKSLVLKSNPQIILPTNLNSDTKYDLTSSFLLSSVHTENDVNSEIKDQTKKKVIGHPAFVSEQYCHYSMDFHHGQVVSVQLSSYIRKGILTPYIQLVDMTKNLKYCLHHMHDPVGTLEQYCTTPTQVRYDDLEHYKSVWIPIILMETATTVIRDGSIVINDITVSVNENGGCFILGSDFCLERNIEFDDSPVFIKEELDDVDKTEKHESQLIQNGDYLCIKCHISTKTNRNMRVHKTIAPHEYKIWTSHAKTTLIHKTNKNTSDEELMVHFRFIKNTSKPSNDDFVCTVEVLQTPAIDKRVQFLVEHVNRSTPLAKAIALNGTVPTLDTNRIDAIRDYDVDIGLPTNNTQQEIAIRLSLRSTFSLIHGPPGTGKTNMGIKLICLFNDINKRVKLEKDLKKQIIYCGPSNRSVDLVAAQFLLLAKTSKNVPTITRLYERSIENMDYPLPGRVYSTKKNNRESKADERLKDVTIHHLIRRPGNPHADEIQSLYSDIVQTQAQVAVGKNQGEFKKSTFSFENESQNFLDEKKEDEEHQFFIDKIKEYTKLELDLTIKELAHYDVVFCTTAMATNSKVLKEMEGRIYQVIIDNCGMCTEPECISTIIATKAKQVVLIGDHKQLQPVVVCPQARQLGLQKSLFERYQNDKTSVHLTVQYRMHQSICEFPSRKFYNNRIVTHEKSTSYVENIPFNTWVSKYNRTVFCQIEGEEEISLGSTEGGNEMSFRNQAEVNQVIKIYRHLHNNELVVDSNGEETTLTINIMSQYNGQCASIRSALAKVGLHGANVNTVVASQGGEWDYVIFSLVRSLPDYKIEKFPTRGWCLKNLGFITDEHQINVAITRAKKGLFLIGNKHLLECDDVWKDLIQTYEIKGCVVDGLEYPPPYQKRTKKKKHRKPNHKDTDKDRF